MRVIVMGTIGVLLSYAHHDVTAEAEVPQGYEIVAITDNPNDRSRSAGINSCGQVVFRTRFDQDILDQDILLYDNGALTQLSPDDDIANGIPDINERGDVAWARTVGAIPPVESALEIVLYVNGKMSILTDNDVMDTGPTINNFGHVAWNRWPGEACSVADVYLYDGRSIEPIATNGFSNQGVMLNDNGALIWTRYNFCPAEWESEIQHWVDGVTTQLSFGLTQPQLPDINNAGDVMWSFAFAFGQPGLWEIRDGVSQLFTDWGRNSRINNHGDVYFIRWYDDTSTWQSWVFLNDAFYQITDDPFWNTDGDINDYGEVVWESGNVPTQNIKYMRRIRTGEADFDGHIDLQDAAAFQNCYTGPGDFDGTVGGFDRLCDCRFLDIDHDRDVDRDDYALFATAMTGPQ